MSGTDSLQFNWSVWDNNPTVSWTRDGVAVSVSLSKPPISVTNLATQSLIAIVGNFDELGSSNLLLYSYDGVLRRRFVAPDLGAEAQFGRVLEMPDGVSVIIGFYDQTGWVEKWGKLDIKDGTIGELHRSY